MKRAETEWAEVMVTAQVGLVPEHAPAQPAKVAPAAGLAVSVTTVPASKLAEQVLPQSMPDGEDETVPPAVRLTPRAWVIRVKVAVTERAASIDTVQLLPDTESQPIQEPSVEVGSGVAVSVTVVPPA